MPLGALPTLQGHGFIANFTKVGLGANIATCDDADRPKSVQKDFSVNTLWHGGER
jgi:hypothetical protein